jgi:hypothetical protein
MAAYTSKHTNRHKQTINKHGGFLLIKERGIEEEVAMPPPTCYYYYPSAPFLAIILYTLLYFALAGFIPFVFISRSGSCEYAIWELGGAFPKFL